MQNHQTKEKLGLVLSRVLEQVAFVFPEPMTESDKIDPAAESFIEISLRYWGASSGRVALILPASLSRQFSAGMLGLDPDTDDTTDSQTDAAKEIGNIVTGQVLTELFGSRAIYNMAAPEVRELAPADFFAILDGGPYVCCQVEGRPVIAVLTETEGINERQSTHR